MSDHVLTGDADGVDLKYVAANERVNVWSRWVTTQFGMSVTGMQSTGGCGAMFQLGPARLWNLQSPPRLSMRGPRKPAAHKRAGLFVQISGTTTFRIGRRDEQLGAGEISIGGGRLSSGFGLVCSEDASHLFLSFPWEMLSARHPWLHHAPRIHRAGELGVRLLIDAIRGAARDAPALDADQGSLVFSSLIELAGLPRMASTRAQEEDFRVRRGLRAIEEQLHVRTLDAQTVAAVSGLSRRRLDQLFVRQLGMSVSARIAEARLTRAAALLADPCNEAVSITEIAYATGFCESSQFTRAFRARFGCPPSRYRRTKGDVARARPPAQGGRTSP